MASSQTSREIGEEQSQCKSPAPPQELPWMMLSFEEGSDIRSFFSLSDGKIHRFPLPNNRHDRIIGSVDGWLVLVDQETVVHLLDPIKNALIHLPALTTMSEFIIPREDAEGTYKACGDDDEFVIHVDCGTYTTSSDHLRDLWVQKLVLSIDGTAMANMWHLNRLAFARAEADKWEVADTFFECTDMLCYEGQLYAVDREGVVARCDVGPPATVTPITSGAPKGNRACLWYLVESSGELLLVARYKTEIKNPSPCTDRTKYFEVFKLDRLDKEAKLVEVRSLGDRMLFLGTNRSLSLDAKDYPGCKGNRIYFTCSIFGILYDGDHVTDDFGMFNMEDGSIESIPCYPDNSKVIWPPPIWFAPNRI